MKREYRKVLLVKLMANIVCDRSLVDQSEGRSGSGSGSGSGKRSQVDDRARQANRANT